ncbi:MAG: hypothetical protein INR71_04175 [Terriglobus roseus]|nr:hypothetical protein [Terriglobus roseus]
MTGSQARNARLDLEQAFLDEVGPLTSDADGYGCFKDPSSLTSDPLRDLLKEKLPLSLTYTQREARARSAEYAARVAPEHVSPFVDRLARFLVAVLGGSSLVVPMLIMRLPNVTLAKSLVATSIAVLSFAGVLSVGFRATNTETIIATATYAAVLVVFVGTSSQG